MAQSPVSKRMAAAGIILPSIQSTSSQNTTQPGDLLTTVDARSGGGVGTSHSKKRRGSAGRVNLVPISSHHATTQRRTFAKQASAVAASEGVDALTDNDVNKILGSLFLDNK